MKKIFNERPTTLTDPSPEKNKAICILAMANGINVSSDTTSGYKTLAWTGASIAGDGILTRQGYTGATFAEWIEEIIKPDFKEITDHLGEHEVVIGRNSMKVGCTIFEEKDINRVVDRWINRFTTQKNEN